MCVERIRSICVYCIVCIFLSVVGICTYGKKRTHQTNVNSETVCGIFYKYPHRLRLP